jgi:hypothetical protein
VTPLLLLLPLLPLAAAALVTAASQRLPVCGGCLYNSSLKQQAGQKKPHE